SRRALPVLFDMCAHVSSDPVRNTTASVVPVSRARDREENARFARVARTRTKRARTASRTRRRSIRGGRAPFLRLRRARHGSFAGGGDVFRARVLEDLLRALGFVGALGVNGDQDVAAFDLAFVAFGFELGDAETDERARDAAYRGSDRGAAERGHQ